MRKAVIALLAVVGLTWAAGEPAPFQGEYTLNCKNLSTGVEGEEGEEYQEKLVIHYFKYGDIYIVERTAGDVFSSEDGIAVDGTLGAWQMTSGMPLSVYQKQGDGISSLTVSEDGEIHAKTTEGATPLEISTADVAGKYKVEGARDDGSEPYETTMSLERNGPVWQISGFGDGSCDDYNGVGVMVDDFLVLTLYHEGKHFLKVYRMKGRDLAGRWYVSHWDFEHNEGVLTYSGRETLTAIEPGHEP